MSLPSFFQNRKKAEQDQDQDQDTINPAQISPKKKPAKICGLFTYA
jgi:hypothetical protein